MWVEVYMKHELSSVKADTGAGGNLTAFFNFVCLTFLMKKKLREKEH
jgi:hypothetical protein